MPTANGSFKVDLKPVGTPTNDEGVSLATMSINKVFEGDLVGTSVGEMLSAAGAEKGSAGYVAIERVTGTVHGKRGAFALMHTGTMDLGAPQLSIIVVPGSGTGELTGMRGVFHLTIVEKQHRYALDYTLG